MTSLAFQRAAPHQANWAEEWRRHTGTLTPTNPQVRLSIPRDMPRRTLWLGVAMDEVGHEWSTECTLQFLLGGQCVYEQKLNYGRRPADFQPARSYFCTFTGYDSGAAFAAPYWAQMHGAGQPYYWIYFDDPSTVLVARLAPFNLTITADALQFRVDRNYNPDGQVIVWGCACLSHTESL